MRCGSFAAVVVVALVAGVLAGAGGAFAAPDIRDPVVLAPLEVEAVADGAAVHRLGTVEEALVGVRDHRDRAAWLSSVAQAMRRTSGLEPLGPPPGDHTTSDGVDRPTGAWAQAGPAGDLTGNGRDDVLVSEHDLFTGRQQLRALRGVNGVELWRRAYEPHAGLVFPLHADLDGDGIPDILRFDLVMTDDDLDFEEEPGYRRESVMLAYTWRIEFLSGADGTQLWLDEVDGELHEVTEDAEEPIGREQRYELRSTALTVLPVLSPSPDGPTDVWLEAIDLDVDYSFDRIGPSGAAVQRYDYDLTSATTASLRDGADGAERTSRVFGPAPAITVLYPVGDLTGNGLPDLLVDRELVGDVHATCAAAGVQVCPLTDGGADGLELEVLDGVTLERVWLARSEAAQGFAMLAEADLTGDGAEDLLRFSVTDDSVTGQGWVTEVLAGADGEVAWRREEADGWLLPLAVGDFGGPDGADLLAAAPLVGDERVQLRVDRLAGATGEVLRSTIYTPEAGPDETSTRIEHLYAAGVPDVDGDGQPDVVAGQVTTTFTPDGELRDVFSDEMVESGADGARLRELTTDGAAATLAALADVTGDGRTEVLRVTAPADGGTHVTEAVVPAGPGGLWQRASTVPATVVAAGAQSGPGEDLLEIVNRRNGSVRSATITSVAGATGENRWQTIAKRDS